MLALHYVLSCCESDSRQSHYKDVNSLSSAGLDIILSHPSGGAGGSYQSLLTSHLAGDVYQSEGCHTTELLLSCPPTQMVIIHSATFSPTRQRVNCSQITRHSQLMR